MSHAGKSAFTLDGAKTKFPSLKHLVDFYKMNPGPLPVLLRDDDVDDRDDDRDDDDDDECNNNAGHISDLGHFQQLQQLEQESGESCICEPAFNPSS